MAQAASLEIVTPPADEEFLIGDVPALTVRADRAGVGVLGGIALTAAQSIFLPLGPPHVAALGRAHKIIRLTSGQVAEVNARQLSGVIDYVYLRSASPPTATVRSFARQTATSRGMSAHQPGCSLMTRTRNWRSRSLPRSCAHQRIQYRNVYPDLREACQR